MNLFSDLSSTVEDLHRRVETIEGTVSDHEDRLTTVETQIQGGEIGLVSSNNVMLGS